MSATIFFATGNAHKLEEVEAILPEGIQLRSFRDAGTKLEVEETELTLEGNALLKARAWFEHTGVPSFADDTGLEVIALGGAPGVLSARYAGEDGNAEKNMQKLLAELEENPDREAQFRTVIAWVDGKKTEFFEGILEGNINYAPKGRTGFGYDPIFVPKGYDKTLAELGPEIKNQISHRAIAVRKFAEWLKGRY